MTSHVRVLWIEDEQLPGFKAAASLNGITLTQLRSLNAGLSELERNFKAYDVVLLDGKFVENEDDKKGTEHKRFAIRAKERIQQLPEPFEIHLFTGQADLYRDDTFHDIFLPDRIYRKGVDADEDRLLENLRLAALNRASFLIRQAHPRIFALCTDRYLGTHAEADLIALLQQPESEANPAAFNTLRKLIEDLFRSMHRHELLPDWCVEHSVALNETTGFLCGDVKRGMRLNPDAVLPSPVTLALRTVLLFSQEASHRLEVDRYASMNQSSYSLKGVLYLFFDILLWFQAVVDANPQKANWQSVGKSTLRGMLKLAANGNWSFLADSPPGKSFYIPSKFNPQNYGPDNRVLVVFESDSLATDKPQVIEIQPEQ
jgi:hypothetical protein